MYKNPPVTQETRAEKAHDLYLSGQKEAGIAQLRALVRENPKDTDAWSFLGQLLETEGNNKEALAVYREARDANKENPEMASSMSRKIVELLFEEKQYEACRHEARVFINLFMEEELKDKGSAAVIAAAYGMAGTASLKLGGKENCEDAVKCFRKQLDLIRLGRPKPERVEDERVHHNLGEAYLKEGKWSLAEESFTKVITLNRNLASAWMFRGLARVFGGDSENGLDDINSALRIKPDYYRALCAKGQIEIRMGRFKDAIESFSRAHELKKDDKEIAYWLDVAMGRISKITKHSAKVGKSEAEELLSRLPE